MLWLLECGRFKLIAPHLGRSYSHFNVLAQLPIGPLVGGCSNASEQSCCEWVGDCLWTWSRISCSYQPSWWWWETNKTILNIGPSTAPNCWNTIWVRFCGFRWVSWSLFCGAAGLKWSRRGLRAGSSHKSKQQNTLFHVSAQSFCTKAVELPI